MLSNGCRKCFRQLRKEWMEQIGNNQTYQVAAPGNQTSGRDIGLIIKFFYALEHAFAGFLCDIWMVSQDLGDGYDRKTQISRYVFQADSHVGNIQTISAEWNHEMVKVAVTVTS